MTIWGPSATEAPLTTSNIIIRPLTAAALDRFLALEGPSHGPPGRDFLATAAENHYRPHWTWVADVRSGDR